MSVNALTGGVFVKIEATPGVAETTAGTDAMDVDASSFPVPSLTPEFPAEPRKRLNGSINPSAPRPGRGNKMSSTLVMPLFGKMNSGAVWSVSNLPMVHPVLLAAGYSYTILPADAGVHYVPSNDSADFKTATVDIEIGPIRYQATGARFNPSIAVAVGKPVVLTAPFEGVGAQPETVTPLEPVVPDEADNTPLCVGINFTLDGYAALTGRDFTVETGNEIVSRPDFNSPNGLKDPRIASRASRWTGTVELEALEDFDFESYKLSGEVIPFSWQAGDTAGNIVGSDGHLSIETASYAIESGKVIVSLGGGLYNSSASVSSTAPDYLTLKFS